MKEIKLVLEQLGQSKQLIVLAKQRFVKAKLKQLTKERQQQLLELGLLLAFERRLWLELNRK